MKRSPFGVPRSFRSLLSLVAGRLQPRDTRQPPDPFFSAEELAKAKEAVTFVRPYSMLSSRRLLSLYHQVLFCEQAQIAGSLVECGVWKGGSVALMALANLAHGRERRVLHLFDSFSEICEPDEAVDGERAIRESRPWSTGSLRGRMEPLKGIYDSQGGPGSLEEVRQLLERSVGYDPAQIVYHKGWFEDVIPRDEGSMSPIALLRLDGDWYRSTRVALKHLYGKVVSGGFIVIDDYGAYDGCRRAADEFLAEVGLRLYLNSVDDECKYWIKP